METIKQTFRIHHIPEEAKSLALIVDDPDAPKGTFTHWVMWNIPPQEIIEENTDPGDVGLNGKGENKYTGPCPPNGTHRYHFKVYALDTFLNLDKSSDKEDLLKAMEHHILSQGELTGKYSKE